METVSHLPAPPMIDGTVMTMAQSEAVLALAGTCLAMARDHRAFDDGSHVREVEPGFVVTTGVLAISDIASLRIVDRQLTCARNAFPGPLAQPEPIRAQLQAIDRALGSMAAGNSRPDVLPALEAAGQQIVALLSTTCAIEARDPVRIAA